MDRRQRKTSFSIISLVLGKLEFRPLLIGLDFELDQACKLEDLFLEATDV